MRRTSKKAIETALVARATRAVAQATDELAPPAPVERAADEGEATAAQLSRQPRFSKSRPSVVWTNTCAWLQTLAEIEVPAYIPDSRKRDIKLCEIARAEPRLAGIINSVVMIDANRGYELIGGRNQVARYSTILSQAEGGRGYRPYVMKQSYAYWVTDMGAISECLRDGEQGPLRGLAHLDPLRCRLTGDPREPLEYSPRLGGLQRWRPGDFFRVCSLPSISEEYNDLGFCAVSRALELVRTLYAVLAHDQELLAARAPKGLLLLQNISKKHWEDAMAERAAKLDGMERQYYGGVAVLAGMGPDTVDAKLVALSELPANFNMKTFVDLSMYGLALCFGYDPREFWPVSAGTLGTGNETEAQARKASGKGGYAFTLAFQEQLQRELPETLQFQYEQRDDAGEISAMAVLQAKASYINSLAQGPQGGEGIISRDEARLLAAEQGLIPEEWTSSPDQTTVTDTDDSDLQNEPAPAPEEGAAQGAERWLDLPRVQRAMTIFPDEDIVRYTWNPFTGARQVVLWRPRNRPRLYAVATVRREDGVLYDEDGVRITESDVERAIDEGRRRVGEEYGQLLNAPTMTEDQRKAIEG